jgi:dTMP kinase
MHRLREWLESTGRTLTALRQPGGTSLGNRIRGIVLDSRSEAALGPMAPLAELALMFADRAQAIAKVIQPALERGDVVLCDRYTDSSEAYQGGGRGLGAERVLALHAAVCNGLQPDLTVMLLPELEVSLGRARGRNLQHVAESGTDENRFEREGDGFYRRIYAGYQAIAARDAERVVVFGDGGLDEVELAVRAVVDERLKRVGL